MSAALMSWVHCSSEPGLKNCCPIQQCQHSNFVKPTNILNGLSCGGSLKRRMKATLSVCTFWLLSSVTRDFYLYNSSRECSWSDQRLHPVLLLRDILHPPMLYMYENGVLYTLTHPILCIGEYSNVNPKSTTILA